MTPKQDLDKEIPCCFCIKALCSKLLKNVDLQNVAIFVQS